MRILIVLVIGFMATDVLAQLAPVVSADQVTLDPVPNLNVPSQGVLGRWLAQQPAQQPNAEPNSAPGVQRQPMAPVVQPPTASPPTTLPRPSTQPTRPRSSLPDPRSPLSDSVLNNTQPISIDNSSNNERTNPFASLAGREGGRLFRTPHMFGDFTNQMATMDVFFGFGDTDVPLAGGARRMKVAEQNRAMPQDRVYFFYNYFHNAIQTQANGPVVSQSASRYTLGLEKAFNNDRWSVDLRFPLTNEYDSNNPVMPVQGGEVGNLQVIIKHRLTCSPTMVTAAGLGIDTPTGSGVLIDAPFADQRIAVANNAVNLQPFVAFQAAPNDLFFANGFLQLDVPVNGNQVTFEDTVQNASLTESVDEGVLFHVDVSGGVWLFETTDTRGITGLAAVAEFHYATGLSDPDTAVFNTLNTSAQYSSADARANIANVTVGLHTALGRSSSLRFAGVFPLSGSEDRVFDSEMQASLILGY